MRWMRWGLLILMPSIAGGCAATTGDFCDVASVIRPALVDQVTDGTKDQIVKHNRYGEKHCGWRP